MTAIDLTTTEVADTVLLAVGVIRMSRPKLLRDFARLWAQFLAIALVLAAGVAVLLMSFGMSRALDETRARIFSSST